MQMLILQNFTKRLVNRLGIYISVNFSFLKYIFLYTFGIKSNKKEYISGLCLINKPEGSYRIKGTEHTDLAVILKYAYRLLLKWRKSDFKLEIQNDNGIGLYDAALESEVRLNFIESVSSERPGLFIPKERVSYLKQNGLVAILKFFVLGLVSLLLFPFSVSRKRAQVALVLHEADEAATLLYICKKHNIKKLYYSCIFEKDSNATALLLMKRGIEVIKNPSEDPLYFSNQMIIASQLGICNPYQKEEVKKYSETIWINGTQDWYPETHLIQLKGKSFPPAEKGVIGYYSGSSWLRIVLNYNLVSAAFDPYKAEAECEEHIATFMKENPGFTLRVFLHPLEKKHIALTRKHFENIWPGITYEYENLALHTTETFHRCDVAVTVFSGVMFYRYYAGYKGLMYCPYMPGFPIENSIFDEVGAKNYEAFSIKLKSQLSQDQEGFKINTLRNKFIYG